MAQASAMETLPIFEDRASAVSRVPSHSGHVAKLTARSTKARMCGCIASRSLLSIDFCSFGIRPSQVRLIPLIFTLVGSRYRKSCRSFLVYLRIGLSGSKKPDSVMTRTVQPPPVQVGMVKGSSDRDLESS